MIREGLLFESTDGRSRFLVEPGDTVVVGRAPLDEARDVRAPWASVSRRHVVISNRGELLGGLGAAPEANAGHCAVRDAGSAGGAFVDGRRISGVTPIAPGARLQLASDAVYATRAFRGTSVTALLRRGPMPAERVAAMTHDLLVALAPLHDAGGAHGGLTPEEILVGEHDELVLLVRGWPTVDASGALLGNPAYVSPELLVPNAARAAAAATAATDAYALACIAYEALTGAGPFPIDGVASNLRAKLEGPRPSIDASWPEALRRWLEEAFALQPEARSATRDALGRSGAAAPDAVAVAHAEICAALARVAAKWAGLREAYTASGGDERDWAKGNGRWSASAAQEVAALRLEPFASAHALVDAVDGLLRARAWDGEYDEPTHAREEMLAAVAAVRARLARRHA